jgi:sporulation protein YlmC with PRC-barrel domain
LPVIKFWPLINLYTITIIAITSNILIKPPPIEPIAPTAQRSTNIITTIQIKSKFFLQHFLNSKNNIISYSFIVGMAMEKNNIELAFGEAIRTKDLIGKSVINAEGKQIGKVGELLFGPVDFCLRGLIVKRGLISTDLFIGRDFIKNMSKEGVELLASPFIESTGIKVFDTNGKQIGIVKSIKRFGNSTKIISIIID